VYDFSFEVGWMGGLSYDDFCSIPFKLLLTKCVNCQKQRSETKGKAKRKIIKEMKKTMHSKLSEIVVL
jgi:hypothetical protein